MALKIAFLTELRSGDDWHNVGMCFDKAMVILKSAKADTHIQETAKGLALGPA